MTHPPLTGDYTAFIADARTAHALFESMRTQELVDLQAAHEADLAHATTPEGIAFGAGRLALIAAVLKARGETT
jgi:hypothetical protein